MYGKAFLSALLLSSLLLPIRGQQPQPAPSPVPQRTPPAADEQDVVRITTNLVQVDAVVTKDGRPVTDLKPEDFEIAEDGRPQTITNFSYVSNSSAKSVTKAPAKAPGPDNTSAPIIPPALHPDDVHRTIALVVDDLGMSQESTIDTRQRLRKFVNEELQPNDLVVTSKGYIYFTETGKHQVTVVNAKTKEVRVADVGITAPNGIALSPSILAGALRPG